MRTGSVVFSRASGVRSRSPASTSSSNCFSKAEEGSLGWLSSTSMPRVPMVVSKSSRSSGEWTTCAHDVQSPEDLDGLLTTIGTRGIDVLESQPKLPSSAFEKQFEEEVEAGELDLTPGALEKTNDPVRIYLREMGIVPLLTREGELDIA